MDFLLEAITTWLKEMLVGGIMGMHTYNENIRNSLELAKVQGLEYSFQVCEIPGAHPNTAKITLEGESGARVEVVGASIGGGNILVTEINGMAVSFTGQHNTLLVLHYDKPGTIAAVTNFMAYSEVNIGNFRLTRPQKGGEAVMTIEVDGENLTFERKAVAIIKPVILLDDEDFAEDAALDDSTFTDVEFE